MPQFDVSSFSSQLFWLFVVFTVLYFIVSRIIAPAAENILTSRNRFVQDNVDSASSYNQKSAELERLKNEKLDRTNAEAEEIRHKALKELNDSYEKRRKEVIDDLKHKTSRATDEIKLFMDNFHARETEPCVNLAAAIIEKITGKKADMKLLMQIEKKYKN